MTVRPGLPERMALRVLQVGAIAVVLAAAPYKAFDLDRFFVPKELILHATALIATVLCLLRARRIGLGRVDQLLGLFLVLGVLSALFAGALILSRSRAAWLALSVGAVVLLPLVALALRRGHGSLRLGRLLALPLAAAAGAGVALVMPNTLDWRSDSPYMDTAKSVVNYKEGSGAGRLVQYGNSLRMSVRHPLLGVGPGNWAVDYPRFAANDDPSLSDDGMTSNPWPSSDWMTFVSERGLASFVLLGLAMIALLADGLRAVREGRTPEERLTACTLLGTLAILVVVGTFDAVLLLPVPALVAWTLLGALAAPTRERKVVQLSLPLRGLAIAALIAVGGFALARSETQPSAMSIVIATTRAAQLEEASALDPGSYRIHVRLAEAYARRGSCRRGLAHAKAPPEPFPNAPPPERPRVARRQGG